MAADVTAGASPFFLGNGATFIVPINGLTFDWNPDYQHKIDINLKICDNTPTEESENPCYQQKDEDKLTYVTPLLKKQCEIYSYLFPLLSSVKPPRDVDLLVPGSRDLGYHYACGKDGQYHKKLTPPGFIPTPT